MTEPIHSHQHIVDERAHVINYPDHPERAESALYRRTHHDLCVTRNIGCWICGVKHSEGVHTETHHFFCEWAAMGAVDWAGRFAQEAKWMFNPQSGHNIHPLFDWDRVAKDPTIFVDSMHNMIVLCPVHHRDPVKGIHHVPYPEWILQRFPVEGFTFLEGVQGQ